MIIISIILVSSYHTIIIPNKININKKGNNTKNHAIPGAPALQIKFNIQVQNKIYNILTMKIKITLDTAHE